MKSPYRVLPGFLDDGDASSGISDKERSALVFNFAEHLEDEWDSAHGCSIVLAVMAAPALLSLCICVGRTAVSTRSRSSQPAGPIAEALWRKALLGLVVLQPFIAFCSWYFAYSNFLGVEMPELSSFLPEAKTGVARSPSSWKLTNLAKVRISIHYRFEFAYSVFGLLQLLVVGLVLSSPRPIPRKLAGCGRLNDKVQLYASELSYRRYRGRARSLLLPAESLADFAVTVLVVLFHLSRLREIAPARFIQDVVKGDHCRPRFVALLLLVAAGGFCFRAARRLMRWADQAWCLRSVVSGVRYCSVFHKRWPFAGPVWLVGLAAQVVASGSQLKCLVQEVSHDHCCQGLQVLQSAAKCGTNWQGQQDCRTAGVTELGFLKGPAAEGACARVTLASDALLAANFLFVALWANESGAAARVVMPAQAALLALGCLGAGNPDGLRVDNWGLCWAAGLIFIQVWSLIAGWSVDAPHADEWTADSGSDESDEDCGDHSERSGASCKDSDHYFHQPVGATTVDRVQIVAELELGRLDDQLVFHEDTEGVVLGSAVNTGEG